MSSTHKKQNKNIALTCIDKDKNVRVYQINYHDKIFFIQCYVHVEKDTLYLESVDIEGAGRNSFGSKMKKVISEVAYEFCKEYKVLQIEISGSRRGTGKTKGKFLQVIKLKFETVI